MSDAAPAIAVTAQETPATTPPVESAPPAADAVTPPAAEPAKLWTEPVKEEAPPADAPKETAPEWFMKDKYKTIEDQAKARFDLEKLMGKNWGAPKDDYKIDGIEGIAKDDPILPHLAPALKELGLSQDGFNHLVKSYTDAQMAMAKKIEAEVTETLLREDALTVQAVDKWLNTAFDEEDRKTIQSWIVGVDDFKILNTIRTMLPGDTSVPSSTAGNAAKFESTSEVENEKVKYRKEVAEGLRVEDKNYANELQQRWKDAYTRENYNKLKKK